MTKFTIEELTDKIQYRQVTGIVYLSLSKEDIVIKIKELKKLMANIGIKDANFNKYLENYIVENESNFDLVVINTDKEQLIEEDRYSVLNLITKLIVSGQMNYRINLNSKNL